MRSPNFIKYHSVVRRLGIDFYLKIFRRLKKAGGHSTQIAVLLGLDLQTKDFWPVGTFTASNDSNSACMLHTLIRRTGMTKCVPLTRYFFSNKVNQYVQK